MPLLSSYIASISSSFGYATTINGLTGGPPLAYWRFADLEGAPLRDEKGLRNGIYAGSVQYGVAALPQESDASVNFGGTGTGQVDHDPVLALPAFSLSFWFRVNSLPPDVDPNETLVLVSKDQTGLNLGDFSVFVFEDGSLNVNFQTGSGSFSITSSQPVETDTTYHVVVRADSTGFDAYLDGKYLGKRTEVIDAWSSNTLPIGFATAPWAIVNGDCALDEVALYPRVISESEVVLLAQQIASPTAGSFAAAVNENTTTAIKVADDQSSSWIGSKANLTITITAPPGGGDSAAVTAENDIAYTAGAAANGNRVQSLEYTITDQNGTSTPGIVTVTVVETAATSPIASCYIRSDADTVVVSSGAQLVQAVAAGAPGRNILLRSGSYSGTLNLSGPGGVAGNPLVIRPENGQQSFTANNNIWNIESPFTVIEGINMDGGILRVNTDNIRLTRIRFRDNNSNYFVEVVKGLDCRIDHCDFSDRLPNTGTRREIRIDTDGIRNGVIKRVLIDYCYFHDIVLSNGSNGHEIITPGHAGGTFFDPEITIDHCLFENIDIPGEGELYTGKVSGTKIQFCTFDRVPRLRLTAGRTGHFHEVRSCWFTDDLKTQYLDVHGRGHLIVGNRFEGNTSMRIHAGNISYAEQAALPSVGGQYCAALDVLAVGNKFTGTGKLIVGGSYSSVSITDNAMNTRVEATEPASAVDLSTNEDNTVISPTTTTSFVPAVKLTPSDVGLNVPDPLCG
ncbi:MAG: LamG-like jellyroll fold domain-containing protein [Pseudomonadota bacterium]